MSERLRADGPAPLLEFLALRLPGWSKNTLRQRLDLGCVQVNGTTVTRRDHALCPGDEVTVVARGEGAPVARGTSEFPTLFVDDELVAIDKPAGLLSVSTGRSDERTALALVRTALSRPGRPARLWPVHRLDRETSGVLLFARTPQARAAVQGDWRAVRKLYLAIVEGHPAPSEGVIEAPLWEDRDLNVRVGDGPAAKPARTRYRTLEFAPTRTLLEVELDTGRRHQIRAHLAHLGHPVAGDERHGTAGARLGLHAFRLALAHPRDGRALALEAPPPRAFRALLG